MLVVERQQEPLAVCQQIVIEDFLVANLLDDPSEVHLPAEPPLAASLDFLHGGPLAVETQAQQSLPASFHLVAVPLPRADLVHDFPAATTRRSCDLRVLDSDLALVQGRVVHRRQSLRGLGQRLVAALVEGVPGASDLVELRGSVLAAPRLIEAPEELLADRAALYGLADSETDLE